MTWTRQRLEDALADYERALVEAGRTRGTINTYVGDARRFVEWLVRNDWPRGLSPTETRSEPRRSLSATRVAVASAIPPPTALRAIADDWSRAGRPSQEAIAWPRDRWERDFPDRRELFRSLPSALDRASVRQVCATAATSPQAAENALLATLAWGFGWIGYGPYRARLMLMTPKAGERLRSVARIAAAEGALAAYVSLGTENRIKGLGPAFGTKYLAFCQPDSQPVTALIHDFLVSEWLGANGRPDLRASTWTPEIYAAYLDQMHAWAQDLGITPETLEYLIFQHEADIRGSQWARGLAGRSEGLAKPIPGTLSLLGEPALSDPPRELGC
jgi:hypothetical protein